MTKRKSYHRHSMTQRIVIAQAKELITNGKTTLHRQSCDVRRFDSLQQDRQERAIFHNLLTSVKRGL